MKTKVGKTALKVNVPYEFNDYGCQFFDMSNLIPESCEIVVKNTGKPYQLMNGSFIETETFEISSKETYEHMTDVKDCDGNNYVITIPYSTVSIGITFDYRYYVCVENLHCTYAENKDKAIELATTIISIEMRLKKSGIKLIQFRDYSKNK